MECRDNGYDYVETAPADAKFRIQGKPRNATESYLQLDISYSVSNTAHRQQMHTGVVPLKNNYSKQVAPIVSPFMNNMDEISYWVSTKKAPCLYNYNNTIKNKYELAHCSKFKPKNVCSDAQGTATLSKKKNKRKLVQVYDDSASSERYDVYFHDSQDNKQRRFMSNLKSDSFGSDDDFNIKSSPTEIKRKAIRMQKNGALPLHKRKKLITSTPKSTTLRRSPRRSQQNFNNNNQLNGTLEVITDSIINGSFKTPKVTLEKGRKKPLKNEEKTQTIVGDQSANFEQNAFVIEQIKNDTMPNGQFEDMSDVSGFTATYIRSTKVQKTPRLLRNKSNKHVILETDHSPQKFVMCVNKSVNTDPPNTSILNFSADSSQNIINLVTTKHQNKSAKINRTTSLLKFIESNLSDNKVSSPNNVESKQVDNDVKIQPKASSRYPKRHMKTTLDNDATPLSIENCRSTLDKRKMSRKNSNECNSHRKENPEERPMSRTRSGKKISLTLRQPENSVLVCGNSTEQEISSIAEINVANANKHYTSNDLRETKQSERGVQLRRSTYKSRLSQKRNSLRDRSGYTACFSDTDDDSEKLRRRKYFS